MRRLLPLAAAAALAACAHNPPYQAARFDLPPTYAGAPAAASTPDRWWLGFNDPLLASLIDSALAGAPSVEAAAARLEQAQAGVRAARSAGLPSGTVSGQAGFQRVSTEQAQLRQIAQIPSFNRDQEVYGFTAAASWEADLFGRFAKQRRAARADASAAAADVAGARLTVAAEVADSYLAAREAEARLAAARARVDALDRIGRLVELRYSRGIAARQERDRALAERDAARASIEPLELARVAEANRIDALIGRTAGTTLAALAAAPAPVPAAPTVASADGPPALVRRRPDLAAAERRVAASDARVGIAITGYYPRVSLSAVFGFLSGSAATLFTGGAIQTGAQANVSGRLFDFGAVGADISRARGARAEALAGYRAAVYGALAEVETQLVAVRRNEAQAADLAAAEARLRGVQDAVRAAYDSGAVSLVELLDATRRLAEAQDGLAAARAGTARSAVAAFRALGGGWSADAASPARAG
jgi:NodT family efflux transporter outer membrane factor (OMF) lipoprotein